MRYKIVSYTQEHVNKLCTCCSLILRSTEDGKLAKLTFNLHSSDYAVIPRSNICMIIADTAALNKTVTLDYSKPNHPKMRCGNTDIDPFRCLDWRFIES